MNDYETLNHMNKVYDNKPDIWNCGTLPEDWTLNNLLGKHRSRPYNPDIANVFFRAGEIEAWGRGIERIVAACKKNGYPEPQFDYDGGGLWTIFHFGKEYADTTQKTTQKLSRKQEEILLYLKNNPKASRKDLTDNIIDLTEDGVKYNLKRLKEFGLIRRVGPDKGGFWEIIEQ